MAFYPCRICGNPMDPIYSDGICDDCYFEQSSFLPLKNDKKSRASSRSASSGKKKKSKIQKAAALIMAMMIALSSLCLSAFADIFESGAFVTDGTYMGYEVIKYEPGTEIFNKTLISYFDSKWNYTDNPTQYLSFCLLDFDESGKPYIYTLASTGFNLSCRLWGSNLHQLSIAGFGFNCEASYDPTYFLNIYMSWQDKFEFYTFGNSNPDNKNEYTRTIYCNGGEFTGYQGNDKYLLLIPHADANQATPIFNELLTGNKSDDFVGTDTTPDYPAKFHSFASMNDGDVILNMLDWIGAGKQYPTADFSINDNGQYHSYSLRISLNKNYVDTCMSLWEDWRNNVISSVLPGGLGCLLVGIKTGSTTDIVNGVIQLTHFGSFPISVFTLPSESGTAAAIRKIAQHNMLKSLDDLSYVTQYNLTNGYLNFNEGESPVRAYSVCLADYVTIVKGLLYRLDIVDNDTGIILDTAYFCNDTTYQKTDSGYGCKVYNYDNADNLDNDLDNDNGYSSSSGKVETDKMQSDNNTDIVVNFDPNGLDLSSYMDSLNGLVSDVSSFFTWSWALFPPEIMTIVIIGVGLLVVCGLVKFFVG